MLLNDPISSDASVDRTSQVYSFVSLPIVGNLKVRFQVGLQSHNRIILSKYIQLLLSLIFRKDISSPICVHFMYFVQRTDNKPDCLTKSVVKIRS